MRPVWTALLVYVVAVVAVLGLQLAAVTALFGWRGTIDVDRDGLATLLVGVPASSLALIVIALVAGGRPPGPDPLGADPTRSPARSRLTAI